MSGRGLDDLIEQNETELGFLSAYGGGETPEELLESISKSVSDVVKLTIKKEGVLFELSKANLPIVPSDLERRGFLKGKLTTKGVKVIITDLGPEQKRFIERLMEFIQLE